MLQSIENNAGIIGVQPSSAAAERVFSLLENSFTKRKERSLQGYVSLSIMYHYPSCCNTTASIDFCV